MNPEPEPSLPWDAWDEVWQGYDPAIHDPARPRLVGEITAQALARLDRLSDDLYRLGRDLRFLAEAARIAGLPTRAYLIHEAIAVGALSSVVPEALRDIAARLPIRGLDYEEDQP
jgi:hypothetical protein